ncbi:MAG: c-type cytochrome biogenesis protein CcsB [Desulfosarcinaceae bacterium]|nr:c-type cytochrome biogenesis protein CcsB [Desulfosarcinaceae bacterium]
MTSSQLLSIITFVYAAAGFAYLAGWIFKKDLPGKIGTGLAVAAVVGNLGGILLRWRESYALGIGHAPLSNLYESLVFFALTIGLLYLYLEYRYHNRTIGAFAMPLAFLAMAYASLTPIISDRIQPLVPVLKSNWLIAHVMACFIGYAAFAIAFGVSIMYFFRGSGGAQPDSLLQRLPSDKILDELTHQLVMFGFLWLTAGIITGAVWANSAWGRYWGWDPKETWSLITWLIYAALLHFRLMRGWRGKRIAMLSVVGFMAVLFTYFGVNLLPGLHSYGSFGG